MPFGIVGRTRPGMRQVVGFRDRATVRGTFGGKFGARYGPQGPTGRTYATAPRCGPLAKLLWKDLFAMSSGKITNLKFLWCWWLLQRFLDQWLCCLVGAAALTHTHTHAHAHTHILWQGGRYVERLHFLGVDVFLKTDSKQCRNWR